MLFRLSAAAAAVSLLIAGPARAQSPAPAPKVLVNLDDSGLALQGYDPVAFFTMNKPVPGTAAFTSVVNGATYRFASAEHKTLFEQNPAKYEPAFGGYCAYGVSQGGLFPVDISTFQILHGRLVLNKNPKVRELFDAEREKHYGQAEEKWPGLVEKKGK